MECRITNTKRQAGLGLAEYVVAMGIAVLLVGAICAFSLFTGRSLALFSSFADADLSNRRTVDQMAKDFRSVSALTNFSTNVLNFLDADGTPLNYTYDAGSGVLTRTKANQSTTLLRKLSPAVHHEYA